MRPGILLAAAIAFAVVSGAANAEGSPSAPGPAAATPPDVRERIARLDEQIAREPTALHHYLRARLHESVGDFEKAVADYSEAMRLRPDMAGYVKARGWARRLMWDLEGALADYDQVLRMAPEAWEVYLLRASVWIYRGQPRKALEDANRAVAGKPSGHAYSYRGFAHLTLGDYDAAMQAFDKATEADPGLPGPYEGRAEVHLVRGELGLASAQITMALERSRGSTAARLLAGSLALKRGEPRAAQESFESILRIDPENPEARFGRGVARLRLGRRVDGLADIAAAERLMPQVSMAYARQGIRP